MMAAMKLKTRSMHQLCVASPRCCHRLTKPDISSWANSGTSHDLWVRPQRRRPALLVSSHIKFCQRRKRLQCSLNRSQQVSLLTTSLLTKISYRTWVAGVEPVLRFAGYLAAIALHGSTSGI